MSSRVSKLISTYRQHLTVPWQQGLAAVQRVIFAVYDKSDELRLRASTEEFALVTQQAGRQWMLIDLTNAFPKWMADQEYRDAYFECPEDMAGYLSGELTEFVADLISKLKTRIAAEATPDTVITITTGKKIVVKDPVDEVIRKVIQYRRSIYEGIGIKTE